MSEVFHEYHKYRLQKKAKKRASINSGSWVHPIGQTIRHGQDYYDNLKRIKKEYPQYGKQYAQQLMMSKQSTWRAQSMLGDNSLKQWFSDASVLEIIVYTIIGLVVFSIIGLGAYFSYI